MTADFHAIGCTFPFQHGDKLARTSVAKLLPELFLVIADAMAFNEADKIPRRIADEGGFAKIGIARKIVFRGRVDIGEVASSPAGNGDFPSDLPVVFQQNHLPSPAGSLKSAHQSGRARADNDHVKCGMPMHAGRCKARIQNSSGKRLRKDGLLKHPDKTSPSSSPKPITVSSIVV